MSLLIIAAYHWKCGFPSAPEAQLAGLGLWLSAVWPEFLPPAPVGYMQTHPHGPLVCKASHTPAPAAL